MNSKSNKYDLIKDTKFFHEVYIKKGFVLPNIKLEGNSCICKISTLQNEVVYKKKNTSGSYRKVFIFPELGFVIKINKYYKDRFSYVHVSKDIWKIINKTKYRKFFPELLYESKEFSIEEYRPLISYGILIDTFNYYKQNKKDGKLEFRDNLKKFLKRINFQCKNVENYIDRLVLKIIRKFNCNYYQEKLETLIYEFNIPDFDEYQCGIDQNGDLIYYDYAELIFPYHLTKS